MLYFFVSEQKKVTKRQKLESYKNKSNFEIGFMTSQQANKGE